VELRKAVEVLLEAAQSEEVSLRREFRQEEQGR
jgi:hypothetical protein